MNNLKIKRICTTVGGMVGMLAMNATVFASSGGTFDKISDPIVGLLNDLMTPLLAIVGAIGALYCVLLGVKYAKAEEPQDREKAKSHLKNAIIGFVIIFVLILALKIGTDIMTDWVNQNAGSGTI